MDSFTSKVNELLQHNPNWSKNAVIAALQECNGNRAQALLMLLREGLLTCLNTRERQEQTRIPTLPDLFTQQTQAQQSDNPKRQSRKRKSVQIDSGRTKRTKIDASSWPEPGFPDMDGEFQSSTKKKVPVHIAKRTFIIDSESLSEDDTPNAEESLEEDSDFVEERPPSRPASQSKRSLSRSNEKKTKVSIDIAREESVEEEELKGKDTWIETEDIRLQVKKRQRTERKIRAKADIHRHSKKDSPKHKESLPSSIEVEEDGGFAGHQRFIIDVEEDEEKPYEEANEEVDEEVDEEVNEANETEYEVENEVDEINDELNDKVNDETNEVNEVDQANEVNDETNEVNDEVDYIDNPNDENEYDETKYEAWYEEGDNGGTDEYKEVQHTEQPVEETEEYEEWPGTDQVQNSPPIDPDEERKYKQENEVLRERVEFLEEQNRLLAEENTMLKEELRRLQQTNQSHEEQGVEVDFTVEEPQRSKAPDQVNTSPRAKKTWVFPSEAKTAEAKRSLFK